MLQLYGSNRIAGTAALVAALLLTPSAPAQQPMDPPEVPPPLPPRPSRGIPAPEIDPLYNPESEAPWGLPDDVLQQLGLKAKVYAEYAARFTCTETARLAQYSGGQAKDEKIRRYGYLLVRDPPGATVREFRLRLNREGLPKGEVQDDDPFPPAYAWVFLFSEFNQGFFVYRDLGDRFEGFDWVREIQFRGALGFTDGQDIRQWEGTVLVDAATYTPLEIFAQPTRQDERLLAKYRRWARSFSLIGFRLAPRPMGFRSNVQFRLRRDGLTFPTQVRYDTYRATSPTHRVTVRASTRDYDEYRFFVTDAQDEFEPSDSN